MSSLSRSHSCLARHRQLAPTASVRVSPLCLGAMTFGEAQAERYGTLEEGKKTAFEMLDYFYSSGGNFIDTANMYRHGQSELWLGEWLTSRGNRDEIVLATKYSVGYLGHEAQKMQSNYGGNGSKSLRVSLERSLKQLQTSYIDLFYVHYWDYTVTIPELMHSLNDHVAAGKILYLGISDTPAWKVAQANQYALDHGLRPFVVYQGLWNAGQRDFERDIIPMCRDLGLGICPWGVLGQGRFQTEARYLERQESKEGRNLMPLTEHDKRISMNLEVIAKQKLVTLYAIALAYCLQKAPYVFPIVGGRSVKHLRDSIDALNVHLSDDDIAAVEKGYDFKHGFPHEFLSGSAYTPESMSRQVGGPGDVALTKNLGTFDWVDGVKPIRPS